MSEFVRPVNDMPVSEVMIGAIDGWLDQAMAVSGETKPPENEELRAIGARFPDRPAPMT